MKKAIDINIGGLKFPIEEDAYSMLKAYLNRFESSMSDKKEAREVMEDVEIRVAELFQKDIKYANQVVDERMVQAVISCLGDVEGDSNNTNSDTEDTYNTTSNTTGMKTNKKLYRNPDDAKLAGVCAGIAAYFDLDTTLVRIVFLVALVCYASTFFIYIVIWIVAPDAITIPQKMEMRGVPVTAENIRKFTSEKAV